MDGDIKTLVQDVVRDVAAATRALRLYPETSPIPRQSAESAAAALERAFAVVPVVSLHVTREGFSFSEEPLDQSGPGAADLADAMGQTNNAILTWVTIAQAQQLGLPAPVKHLMPQLAKARELTRRVT